MRCFAQTAVDGKSSRGARPPDSPNHDREFPAETVALIAHLPEAEGPRGRFPWTSTGTIEQPDFLYAGARCR